ncbi:MAG: RNA polymerase factor sigma-54 [Pseudomonadota bacterium]
MNMQLSQRMRQGKTMTAQMQQAISLLQFTNTELLSHIEKEAEENPFIEFSHAAGATPRTGLGAGMGGGMGELQDAISRLPERPTSLYAHVAEQLDARFSSARDRAIAERFLEALDTHGWLDEPIEEIAAACGIEVRKAEAFLLSLQEVEPTGLFARDLAECLRLQVQALGAMTPVIDRLLGVLPKLAAADMPGLLRACRCSMPELSAALKVIRGLDPKPGARFDGGPVSERAPDLIVHQTAREWVVELNRSTLPAVRIDTEAAAAFQDAAEARDYASERLRMARWLHRAVEHRNRTTLAIAAEIMRRQSAFLAHGPERLAPLTLAEVAEKVGVHESTVSRVTMGILIVSPHGTLPLKRFFSNGLSARQSHTTEAPGETSAAAVRHRIQQLVGAEDPLDPLSDDALAKIISEDGPALARRTVAKYRGQLNIPSSFSRRRRARINVA